MLVSVVRVLGLALVGYALLLFFVQRQVAFPGTHREPLRPRSSAPSGALQLWLSTSFGNVEAWFFRAPDQPTAPTVIFAHGNGELIDDWPVEMSSLAAAGINALLVEFPGYGYSAGKPSRASLRETFSGAYDWLVAEGGVDRDRIVAWGRSMGGGAAGDLALDRPVAALVLQSTFSSAAAMARAFFLPGFLVRDRFDNVRAVSEFGGPVLLMHGVRDDVIPYAHAQRLADAREGLEVTNLDCAHNDCGPQWPQIASTLLRFLGENGLLAATGPGA